MVIIPMFKKLLMPLFVTLIVSITSPLCWGISSTVTVHVKVETSPCVINNGEMINVNFGDNLLTTLIDGNEYKKAITYSLDCAQRTNNALKLKISGTASTFNNSALQTNKENIGIKLFSNGQTLPVNQWINFDGNVAPQLSAAPIKLTENPLKGGAFAASATMMIDYQ
jgi:type 1 fimbria pilin